LNLGVSGHIQSKTQALARKFQTISFSYNKVITDCFKDKKEQNGAYAERDRVKYEGDICNIFTSIQSYDDTAQLTRAALKKLILS